MPVRRSEVQLSVERPVGALGATGTVARLSARFDPGPDGTGPTPSELKSALEQLLADLDAIVGPPLAAAPVAGRADREVLELIETYRPRQRELVDLLFADGELTPVEHDRLLEHLAKERRPAATPAPTPVPDQPIAAAPVASDQALPAARPVAELLRTYQISTLKQAGAVRARRQISFAEYMALKRHFETAENEGAGPGGLR